jgi:hypothetical protein
MIDRDRSYDLEGQWTEPGRERYEAAEPMKHRRDRRRRPVIPACSADGE